MNSHERFMQAVADLEVELQAKIGEYEEFKNVEAKTGLGILGKTAYLKGFIEVKFTLTSRFIGTDWERDSIAILPKYSPRKGYTFDATDNYAFVNSSFAVGTHNSNFPKLTTQSASEMAAFLIKLALDFSIKEKPASETDDERIESAIEGLIKGD